MISTKTDQSLYFKFKKEGILVGINGTYEDDMPRSGYGPFKSLCRKTHNRFETSCDDTVPLSFAGFEIKQLDDGTYTTDQSNYVKKKLTILNEDAYLKTLLLE